MTGAERKLAALSSLQPLADWHEDMGAVLWHRLDDKRQVCEPPWCGIKAASHNAAEKKAQKRYPHIQPAYRVGVACTEV